MSTMQGYKFQKMVDRPFIFSFHQLLNHSWQLLHSSTIEQDFHALLNIFILFFLILSNSTIKRSSNEACQLSLD